MNVSSPTAWERVVDFGERCHRYCAFLCIGEAIVFIIVLVAVAQ